MDEMEKKKAKGEKGGDEGQEQVIDILAFSVKFTSETRQGCHAVTGALSANSTTLQTRAFQISTTLFPYSRYNDYRELKYRLMIDLCRFISLSFS